VVKTRQFAPDSELPLGAERPVSGTDQDDPSGDLGTLAIFLPGELMGWLPAGY
jgi:hypothetical protein